MTVNSRVISVLAYIFAFLGASNMIYERFQKYYLSIPFDRGILQGNVAMLAVTLVALLIAQSLRNLERRLTRIEESGKRYEEPIQKETSEHNPDTGAS